MVAVLVRLDREVQYLPDQNVAKSASATAKRMWKTRVFNDDGSLCEEDAKRVTPYTAARTLFPRGWGSDHQRRSTASSSVCTRIACRGWDSDTTNLCPRGM